MSNQFHEFTRDEKILPWMETELILQKTLKELGGIIKSPAQENVGYNLQHNEFGLALETVKEALAEMRKPPPQKASKLIKQARKRMGYEQAGTRS